MFILVGIVLTIISNIPSIENKSVKTLDLPNSEKNSQWQDSPEFNILGFLGIAMLIAGIILVAKEIVPELMKKT